MEVAARQRIIEGLVPAVEADLPVGRGEHDQDQCDQKREDPLGHRRGGNGPEYQPDLIKQAQVSRVACRGVAGGRGRLIVHLGLRPLDQKVLQRMSAGVSVMITDSPSKFPCSAPLTVTLRSVPGSGGRSTTRAAIRLPISHCKVRESIRRSA